MASIYEVDTWVLGAGSHLPYTKNDIVERLGKFYYNIVDIPTATQNYQPESTSVYNIYWGGWTPYGTANTIIPHFFWIPSYAPSIESEPKVDVIKFGDGYEQRTPQGLSTNLLKLDVSFDKRDEAETAAISHFLHARGATEAFAFMPPSPYASMKKFVCRSWGVTMTFQNNYVIKGAFEEVVE
jgi:phage-related protein